MESKASFSCVAHMELIRILGGSTSNQRIIGKIIFPRLKNPIIKLGTTKEVPSTLSPLKFSGCFSDVTHIFSKLLHGTQVCLVNFGKTTEQWKKPGWLGYIGDYTTQLYRDYNKPL